MRFGPHLLTAAYWVSFAMALVAALLSLSVLLLVPSNQIWNSFLLLPFSICAICWLYFDMLMRDHRRLASRRHIVWLLCLGIFSALALSGYGLTLAANLGAGYVPASLPLILSALCFAAQCRIVFVRFGAGVA